MKIKNPTFVLDNGCEILLNKQFSEILSKDVKIQDNLLQPKLKKKTSVRGFTGGYPKVWPFSGPTVTK